MLSVYERHNDVNLSIYKINFNVVYETEVRSKSELDLSLTPVANLAFILGTVGEEVYHLRL